MQAAFWVSAFFQFGKRGVELFNALFAEVNREPRAVVALHRVDNHTRAEFFVAHVLADVEAVKILCRLLLPEVLPDNAARRAIGCGGCRLLFGAQQVHQMGGNFIDKARCGAELRLPVQQALLRHAQI